MSTTVKNIKWQQLENQVKYEQTLIQYREAWKRKIGESQTFQGLPSSPSKISIAQLLQEVIAVRRRRNQELKNVKLYYSKVFDLWQQLYTVRQNQGYNTSKCNLKIYSVEARLRNNTIRLLSRATTR